MDKKKSNKRVEVIFTNGNIIFITRYEGDITYLLDRLNFTSDRSGYHNYMTVYKEDETLDFSYLLNKSDFGNVIHVQYRFDERSEYMHLDRFKALVESSNFIVENMIFVKEKKKRKKK